MGIPSLQDQQIHGDPIEILERAREKIAQGWTRQDFDHRQGSGQKELWMVAKQILLGNPDRYVPWTEAWEAIEIAVRLLDLQASRLPV